MDHHQETFAFMRGDGRLDGPRHAALDADVCPQHFRKPSSHTKPLSEDVKFAARLLLALQRAFQQHGFHWAPSATVALHMRESSRGHEDGGPGLLSTTLHESSWLLSYQFRADLWVTSEERWLSPGGSNGSDLDTVAFGSDTVCYPLLEVLRKVYVRASERAVAEDCVGAVELQCFCADVCWDQRAALRGTVRWEVEVLQVNAVLQCNVVGASGWHRGIPAFR